MPSALVPLANITLGSATASVTFSSIVGTYRDLMLVAQVGHTVASSLRLRANSDSGANYSYVSMIGTGTSTASGGGGGITYYPLTEYGIQATTPIVTSITHLMDYSATDKHKSLITRHSESGYQVSALACRWASTSAITSLVIFPGSSTFVAGSTFALYGVSA